MTGSHGFCLGNAGLASEPYHYTACGLDDVYLLNGFIIHETQEGRGVSIERLDDLHRAIALRLVSHRKRLSPKEFRFLRKQMEMTQNELADMLGVDAQTVARYEKGETSISGPADHLIRFYYALFILPHDEKLRAVDEIKALIEMDEPLIEAPARFAADEHGWREAA